MTTPPAPSTRRRGRLGLVSIGQLVCVELALAVLLFIPPLSPAWIGGIMVAVLLIAFGFHRGQLWYVRLVRLSRLLRRRRQDTKAATAKLAAGPRLSLATINERGTSLGVGFDGTGWFAGLSVDTVAPPHAVFGALTELLSVTGTPVSSIQLVTHSSSANPPRQFSWFVVRLDVRGSGPIAAERGGGVVGIHRALAGTVGRLMKGAMRIGVPMLPLDTEELAGALRFSLDGGSPTDEKITERWGAWQHGDVEQATFSWHGRPRDAGAAEEFWQETVALPSEFCTFSIALRKASDRPNENQLMARCLIRLAAEPDSIGELSGKLLELARSHHVKLRRCDGVQGPAAYASAVTGGVW